MTASTDEIAAHGYVLTPGRYVGAEEAEDDSEPFEEKMRRLTAELNQQCAESAGWKPRSKRICCTLVTEFSKVAVKGV